jgi:hypothetical protein
MPEPSTQDTLIPVTQDALIPAEPSITDLIGQAVTSLELANLWREKNKAGEWTDAHTEAAKQRINQINANVDKENQK